MAAGTVSCMYCSFYRKGESLEVIHMCHGGYLKQVTPIIEHVPLSTYFACKSEHVVTAFHKWNNGERLIIQDRMLVYEYGYGFETTDTSHPVLFHQEGVEKVVIVGFFAEMNFLGGLEMLPMCFQRFISMDIDTIPSLE